MTRLLRIGSLTLAIVLVASLAAAQTVTWAQWRIYDGETVIEGKRVTMLEASLNGIQAQGWTIFTVAPLVRQTSPVPCDAACIARSGQTWAWADALVYDIVAYKVAGQAPAAPAAPTVATPTPVAPAAPEAGLTVCVDRTGAPGSGWVKTSGGGWVPPSSPLAVSGVCRASF